MVLEKAQFSPFGRLSRSDIRYLAFEGGGGKGFAYIGAIHALEALDLLRTASDRGQPHLWTPGYLRDIDPTRRLTPDSIRGIAGSSAGAITALLLSCGYNAGDIQQIMTRFDFSGLFEPPVPRYVPKIQLNPSSDDPRGLVEKPAVIPDSFQQIGNTLRGVGQNRIPSEVLNFLDSTVSRFTRQQKPMVGAVVADATIASIVRLLLLLPFRTGDTQKAPKAVEMLSQFATELLRFFTGRPGPVCRFRGAKVVCRGAGV